MGLKDSRLYQRMIERLGEGINLRCDAAAEFSQLRTRISQEAKYIPVLLPEFTPHDESVHLENLFGLADRVLGADLYERLNPAELLLLAFGLYAHDWGMAVSQDERVAVEEGTDLEAFALLEGEPQRWRDFLAEERRLARPEERCWQDYVRDTHAARGGMRLRKELEPCGDTFAHAVAKVAEGHALDMRQIRDPDAYPTGYAVGGRTANLAALATYVRLVDLLDIADDRTPYALWKFVAPRDPVSRAEWQKHRAIAPVAVQSFGASRRLLVDGVTHNTDIYAQLEDLRACVQTQFAECITFLAHMPEPYRLDLDSGIDWRVEARGFVPVVARFDTDREAIIALLTGELYEGDNHAFLRELLQNSVDAIDTRQELLSRGRMRLAGEIQVSITTRADGLDIDWADNGIGMDADILKDYFATVGRSWYTSDDFRRAAISHHPISRFGIGVLSCFVVADAIEIETRIEPAYGGQKEGLIVHIPGPKAHFRIRRAQGLPIGTTVRLRLVQQVLDKVSAHSIVDYLGHVAGFVRHDIRVSVDGAPSLIRSAAASAGAPAPPDTTVVQRVPEVHYRSVDETIQENVSRNVDVMTFPLGGESRDYQGFFSAVIPKDPTSCSFETGRGFRFSEGPPFEAGRFLGERGQEVFIKGVMASGAELGSYYGDWFHHKLMVNVRDPSAVHPNLGRNRTRISDATLVNDVWAEVGARLRSTLLPDAAVGDDLRAMAAGTALYFARVPRQAIREWFAGPQWPVLGLTPMRGLAWCKLSDLVREEEIVEAPFELGYVLRELFDNPAPFPAWRGPPALVVGETPFTATTPWKAPVVGASRALLRDLGYDVTRILAVSPPPSEDVPLVCSVWTRVERPGTPQGPESLAEAWLSDPSTAVPRLLDRAVGERFPLLFDFPPPLGQFAAIGSRFWNRRHPKVSGIVEALLRLALRHRQQPLPKRLADEFLAYTAGREFPGYVVPSRVSGRRMAVERFQRLLSVARAAGIRTAAEPLDEADFLPGTVAGYANPHHYDFTAWDVDGSEVGKPLG